MCEKAVVINGHFNSFIIIEKVIKQKLHLNCFLFILIPHIYEGGRSCYTNRWMDGCLTFIFTSFQQYRNVLK